MKNNINEGKVLKDLPQTLIFNKKGVQTFPGSQKVALYYCESMKKYFSISYDKNGFELMEESDYSIIEELKNIEGIQEVEFNNQSVLNLDKNCIEPILSLYENLEEESRKDFIQFIEESDQNFLKILEYSVNKFKKEM